MPFGPDLKGRSLNQFAYRYIEFRHPFIRPMSCMGHRITVREVVAPHFNDRAETVRERWRGRLGILQLSYSGITQSGDTVAPLETINPHIVSGHKQVLQSGFRLIASIMLGIYRQHVSAS